MSIENHGLNITDPPGEWLVSVEERNIVGVLRDVGALRELGVVYLSNSGDIALRGAMRAVEVPTSFPGPKTY